jgi:phenylalanyl-tRNA synthetase beta chain
MKVTEHWLREWVDPKQDIQALTDLLSLSGLEVDALHTLAGGDHLIDINITPNRGDCLSILGVARELSVLTHTPLKPHPISPVAVTLQEKRSINISTKDCLFYHGRIIRGVDNTRPTPDFIKTRLEQLGVRCISLVVDITNYVMFELGQPLHAFDLSAINGDITVRDAVKGETLTLLDETKATLDPRTVVIADTEKVLALGGVMGGLDSGVTLDTKDIFLESAFFSAERIAGQTRLFGINSDSAYRFERGLDPTLRKDAMERASQLIIELAGGQAGPIVTAGTLPAANAAISLRYARINRMLGMEFPKDKVVSILTSLDMQVSGDKESWQVIPPSYRFDITQEIDLIEELARVLGYQHIPTQLPQSTLAAIPTPENKISHDTLRALCVGRGYHELITYSFVENRIQQQFTGNQDALMLLNPMTSQMDAMRLSLLPGLLQALCYNQNRQQMHMRLFELGTCFPYEKEQLRHVPHIAGVLSCEQPDKHWQLPKREENFYDIKGDVEALLALTGQAAAFTWQKGQHPALHPGVSAQMMRDNESIGWVGQLHPQIAKMLGLKGKVFVFELQLEKLCARQAPHYQGISKFPSIRRDLAMVVNRDIPAQDLCAVVAQHAQSLLQDIQIFDVYQGEGIAPDKKSVAMGIILQSSTATLVDAEINALMSRVIKALEDTYQATIRE